MYYCSSCIATGPFSNLESNLSSSACMSLGLASRVIRFRQSRFSPESADFLCMPMRYIACSPAQVLAIEIKQYTGENLKTLVPRIMSCSGFICSVCILIRLLNCKRLAFFVVFRHRKLKINEQVRLCNDRFLLRLAIY